MKQKIIDNLKFSVFIVFTVMGLIAVWITGLEGINYLLDNSSCNVFKEIWVEHMIYLSKVTVIYTTLLFLVLTILPYLPDWEIKVNQNSKFAKLIRKLTPYLLGLVALLVVGFIGLCCYAAITQDLCN